MDSSIESSFRFGSLSVNDRNKGMQLLSLTFVASSTQRKRDAYVTSLRYAMMKRLFSKRKSLQPTIQVEPPILQPPPLPSVSLQPKYVVPPSPHPSPYASIKVLVTPEGLLLCPDIQGAGGLSHVKISWGKDPVVEEIESDAVDCITSTTVYGIIGILRLFHGMYA